MGKHRISLGATIAGAAVAACLIGTAAPASADIMLGGYTGPVKISFGDYESFYDPATSSIVPVADVTDGDELIGVLSVTSISSIGGSPKTLWSAGGADGYLVGVFVGPTISNFNPGTGTFNSTSPWTIDLYSSTSQYNAALGTGGFSDGGCGGLGTACYDTVNQPGSTNVLQLGIQTAPGVDPDPANISDGTFSFASDSGSNYYDANVTAGAAEAQFNSDSITNPYGDPNTDFNINSDFCVQGSGVSCQGNQVIGNWEFASSDPVYAAAVPEPGSLGLLGGALVLLGAWTWRRRRQNGASMAA